MSGTAAELVPVREIDDHKVGTGAGRGDARVAGGLRRRDPRALRALSGVAGRRQRPRTSRRPPARPPGRRRTVAERRRERLGATTAIELYDATLRDGMGGGGLSLTADEKLRVVHAPRRARHRSDRGGLPGVKPKGARAVRAARARAARARRDRRVRDDPPARDRGGGRRRAARAGGVLRAGLHARGQGLAAARREGGARLPRGEPAR